MRILLPSIGSALLAMAACAADAGGGDTAGDAAGTESGSAGETGGDGSPCASGPNPTLTLGEGETAFADFEDGVQLELVHGPQGGVHTLMALHAVHIDASETLLGRLEGFMGGELAASSAPYLDMRCNGAEGGLQVWNIPLIWEAPPADLHLQPVTITAEVVDAKGVKLATTKDAVLHDAMLD